MYDSGITIDFICETLADFFDEPCNYGFMGVDIDEFMTEIDDGDWCNDHCEHHDPAECWKRFFALWRLRKCGVVSMDVFYQSEVHPNCTVEILTNMMTGEESVGWWENE